MRLGATDSALYGISFDLQEGFKTPSYPFDETVKILIAEDETVFDVVNFGAREHRLAELTLGQISREDYFSLVAFGEANAGQKIRIERENAAELIFGHLLPGPVWYAYLVAADPYGESAYSTGHQLYSYGLKLDYAGPNAAAVPNAADTSEYDIVLRGDCVQVAPGCEVANKAALDALTGVTGGSIGLTTADLKVYIYNPGKKGGAGWDFLYTLPLNNPAMGLRNGVFRLSAFADISAASPGSGGYDFKGGLIAARGVRFPKYSVAKNGPGVERLEGFGFSLDNSNEIWKFPIENNIPFYGSRWDVGIYDRNAGLIQWKRAGFANKTAFDAALMHFTIEPGVLFQNKSWPLSTVGASNFPDASKKMVGKPALATFGRWDAGELQAIAFDNAPVYFPNGRRYLNFSSWNAGSRQLTLNQPSSQVQAILGYPIADYPQSAGRLLYVMLYSMTGETADAKKLKKVTALADASGNIRLTLDTAFETVPDGTAVFVLHLLNNCLILDEESCIGLRRYGYRRKGTANGAAAPLQLYAKEGENIRPIPATAFKVVEDGKENRLIVDSEFLSLESTGTIVMQESIELTQVSPMVLHDLVDTKNVEGPGGPSDLIDTFPFGFRPEGVESNVVTVKAFERLSQWEDRVVGSDYFGLKTARGGAGRVIAMFSASRTTLAWTPLQGASGYRISRWTVLLGRDKRVGFGAASVSVEVRAEQTDLDTAFGTNGYLTVSGEQTTHYVDSPVPAITRLYEYKVEPILDGSFISPISSNRGRPGLRPAGAAVIAVLGRNEGATIVWGPPDAQGSFSVYQDDDPEPIATVNSSTQSYYLVTGLTNNVEHKFKIAVNSVEIGTAGDKWIRRYSDAITRIPAWWLMRASATSSEAAVQGGFADSVNSDPSREGWKHARGGRFVRRLADGVEFPAAGVVFSWAWKVDHESFPDMSGAKDVRLLGDFVVWSYYGTNTQVPIIIQCRLIKKDKTFIPVSQWAGLQCAVPPETGSYGAYANFLNLPAEKSGSNSDANYKTELHTTDASAVYTGMDLWKLPDHIFEDGANEWKQVEYVMFAIAPAVPIPYTHVAPNAPGYKLGFGCPPGKNWVLVRRHKPQLYVEYTREFEGGLVQPLYAGIDGGRIDDSAGTITGAPYQIIEKARHVIDYVVNKTLGYRPQYIGSEMRSRNGWLWRWQSKESKPLVETLELFARNIQGFFTFTSDDKLCLRNYGVDEPNVNPVFHFTEANILSGSFGDPESRLRNEIFQRFRFLYNYEPSLGRCTEEMILGWDMTSGMPIQGGYRDIVENDDGTQIEVGSLDGLDTLCRLSSYLYASGGKTNEYGFGAGNEKAFELFYRPLMTSLISGRLVEKDLPNIKEIWGVGAVPPKRAMRDLVRRVIKSLCFDSWYFPIACSMRNVVYNPEVQGVADEAGTPERCIKLGDLVTVTGKKTGGQTLRGLVLGMDLNGIYDGYVPLDIFCPRPPGQFGPFVDPRWNAGAPGLRNTANMVFTGNLYGLGGEAGTFPNARGPGLRNTATMRFPDGSFADAQGSGSGKE